MTKPARTLAISLALMFSSSVLAHPECPKLSFWNKDPDDCKPHQHEQTLIGAEEKHIVYFAFDSAQVQDIQDIVSYIDTLKQLQSIKLIGHADRLGSNDYNDRLSEQRVTAVATQLVNSGVNSSKITTDFKGETVPAKTCDNSAQQELIECLHANRRVEIEIIGEKVLDNADN